MITRFDQLEDSVQARRRRIYYATSISTALLIAESKSIWGPDANGAVTFSARREADNRFEPQVPADVSLTFFFYGPVEIVPLNFDASHYIPDTLYMHATEWPWDRSGAGFKVHHAALAADSAAGLVCTGFLPSTTFSDRVFTKAGAYLADEELAKLLVTPIIVSVPSPGEERRNIERIYRPRTPPRSRLAFTKVNQFLQWTFE